MMMIRFFDNSASTTTYYPADRCTWGQNQLADGTYEITNAMFYPGNATAVNLTGEANDHITLGYIGKTGRFVPINTTNTRS